MRLLKCASLLILLSVLDYRGYAQQKRPVYFSSINQLAMLNGHNVVSAAVQSVNGWGYKSWYLGAGVGMDFYRYRSVPLFVDFRRELFIQKNKVFGYADLGFNLPWARDDEDFVNTFSESKSSYKGGLYADFGIGYGFAWRSGDALLLSLGYSYKEFSKTTKYILRQPQGWGPEEEIENVTKYDQHFNRLSLKIGWQF